MKNDTLKIKDDAAIHGRFRAIKYKAGTKEIISVGPWNRNKIMLSTSTGKGIILRHLNNDSAVPLGLTYADLGLGTTEPNIADTTLENASARGAKATGTVLSNILTLQFFFPDGDLPNATYTEFGTFSNGSATVDTGNIFNRALFGTPYEKASGEDTTIEQEFELN